LTPSERPMANSEALRISDPSVVARYLQVRGVLHDRHLARVERLILERYVVQTTRRVPPTLVADVRGGFLRPGLGELWPAVFLTAVDITAALCLYLSPESVAAMGTVLNGPQRIRHRGWESDWWGWEISLGELHPQFYDLAPAGQEEAIAAWYATGLEWLIGAGLLRRKPAG